MVEVVFLTALALLLVLGIFAFAITRIPMRGPPGRQPKPRSRNSKKRYGYPVQPGSTAELWIPVMGKERAERICRYFKEMHHMQIEAQFFHSRETKEGKEIRIHLWSTRPKMTFEKLLYQVLFSLAVNFNPDLFDPEEGITDG